jgi:NitT/TauT family transport system ATP-binding protein
MSAGRLEVEGVCKTFATARGATVEALRDVSFTVAPGEFIAIVGASGSGKSTLLRIIDGLTAPSSGRVLVDGKPVIRPGTDRAMVFQADTLLPWSSILDNVGYGLRLQGKSLADARKAAMPYLELAGLAGFGELYPHQLSGGMRQRANVARALAVEPEILLLDEPFAALDAQTREIMQTELLEIWMRDRKSVILITHQIDEAVFLADRVIVFSARPGRVRDIIPIALPRPRDFAVKRTAEFGAYVDRIWSLIEAEVRAAMTSKERS